MSKTYKKEKDKLFLSSIFIIAYLILKYLDLISKNDFISNNIFTNILNSIEVIFGVGGSIFFINISKNNKLDLKKYTSKILITSIFFFLVNIISGVLGFIVYKSIKEPSRELPKLENIKEHKTIIYVISYIICLIFLFYSPTFLKGTLRLVIMYSVIFIIMIFNFKKELLSSFKIFKSHFKEYNSLVLKTWFKALITMAIINITLNFITGLDTATNQLELQKMFVDKPILILFLATLYAPIAEELMFRGVIRKVFNNKWTYILVSGTLFGAIHVLDDFKTYSELLYIILYSSLGYYLSYLYYKTNNIFASIYFHFLQNTLAVIQMILIYFVL